VTVPVSVVIPTLGRRESLLRCVRAVSSGSATPAEIVVVDQSEDDGLVEACLQAAAPVPIVAVRKPAGSLSAARNAALVVVGQPLVAVTDDDCEPDPNWLAAATAVLDGEPSLVAVCGPVLPLPDPTGTLVPVSSRTSATSMTYARTSEPWRVGSGGNLVARTESLRAAGGYDERLGAGSPGGAGEDVDVLHRLLRQGPIRYDAEAVVRHEQKPRAARRATRSRYGRGVGAAVGIWLRGGEVSAALVLLRWLLLRLRLLTRDPGELRVLAGTAGGLVYGLRARR
jgi:glycosyltransferase involved in cell wall biosynthesis